MNSPQVILTAWDPGDMTGVAVWKNTELVYMDQCAMESIPEVWRTIEGLVGTPTHVIVEDFRLFKQRAVKQAGSQMKASQGIGSLRTLAGLVGARFELQPPSIKATAKKQARITIPSDHSISHEWDAYLHGFHWMLKHGLIETQLKKEKSK